MAEFWVRAWKQVIKISWKNSKRNLFWIASISKLAKNRMVYCVNRIQKATQKSGCKWLNCVVFKILKFIIFPKGDFRIWSWFDHDNILHMNEAVWYHYHEITKIDHWTYGAFYPTGIGGVNNNIVIIKSSYITIIDEMLPWSIGQQVISGETSRPHSSHR